MNQFNILLRINWLSFIMIKQKLHFYILDWITWKLHFWFSESELSCVANVLINGSACELQYKLNHIYTTTANRLAGRGFERGFVVKSFDGHVCFRRGRCVSRSRKFCTRIGSFLPSPLFPPSKRHHPEFVCGSRPFRADITFAEIDLYRAQEYYYGWSNNI